MNALYDLSDKCPACGHGHLAVPCPGGSRCTCECNQRNCGARLHHADPDARKRPAEARAA